MSNKRRHTELVGVDEILRVRGAGAITDRWDNAMTLTDMDTFKYGDNVCMEFNGTSSNVSFPAIEEMTSLSVTGWFYFRGEISSWFSTIFVYGAVNEQRLALAFNNSTFNISLLSERTAGGTLLTAPDFALERDRWYFFAGVKDGNDSLTLYMDGIEVATVALASTDADASVGFSIGSEFTTQNYVGCLMEDVRVFDRAITEAQQNQLWTNSKKDFQQ